ncbi:Putative ribosomal N-acetyltransferase YdaF, partial [Chlamydiales bacterium SCGC AG-110-M15]
MSITPKLDTLIRPLTLNDIEDLYTVVWRNRDRLRESFPWPEENYSVHIAEKYILKSMQDAKDGQGLVMGLFPDNSLIGSVSIREISARDKRASISYWIDQEHEGRGLIYKAVLELMEIAFEECNLHRLQIYTAEKNKRSRALAEKLGFHLEGVLRDYEYLNGEFLNH